MTVGKIFNSFNQLIIREWMAEESNTSAQPSEPIVMYHEAIEKKTGPTSNRRKSYLIYSLVAVVVVVVVAGLLFFIYSRPPPIGAAGTSINKQTLLNQANLTYGVPQGQDMQQAFLSVSANFTILIYGFNYTVNAIQQPGLPIIQIPQQYSSLTTPLIVAGRIWNFSNYTVAQTFFNNYLAANPNEFTQTSTVGTKSFIGNPQLNGLQAHIMLFVYKKYVVDIDTYGNIGHFNSSSYTYVIARHTYSLLTQYG